MTETDPGVVFTIVVTVAMVAGICAPLVVWRLRRGWLWLAVATGALVTGFGLRVVIASTSLHGGETSSHDGWLLIAIFVIASWLLGLLVGGLLAANWAVLRGRGASDV